MFDEISVLTHLKNQLMMIAPDYTLFIAGVVLLYLGIVGILRSIGLIGVFRQVGAVNQKGNGRKFIQHFILFRFFTAIMIRTLFVFAGWFLLVAGDEQANKNIDDQKIIELKESGVLNDAIIDRILRNNYITGESIITFSKIKDAIGIEKASDEFERRMILSKIKDPSDLEAIESDEQKELRNKLLRDNER